MKKILKITGISLAVILVLLIVTPFLFKDRIEKYAMKMANESLMVDISWKKLGVSLISGFPDLKVTLKDFAMVNRAPFEGDTLFGCAKFGFDVDLVNIIKGNIVVKSILIDDAVVNALSDLDGNSTWDIMPPSDEEEVADTLVVETGGEVVEGDRVALESFRLRNGRVVYDSQSMPMTIALNNVDLQVKGGVSFASSLLDIKLKSDDLEVVYDGTTYLKKAFIEAELSTDANIDDYIFDLKDVTVNLNGLILGAEGRFAMPDEYIFDIRYFTKEASMKTLLGFAPAEYLVGYEDLRYSGQVTMEGVVSNIMDDVRNPDVSLTMVIKDGAFAYPDLPKEVSNVQMDLDVFYDGGSGEKTTVDLKNLSLDLGGNPFGMHAYIATPMSDMQIDAGVKGAIDFATLADVIPLEGSTVSGLLDLDLDIHTKMSYIDNEDYENVDVKGLLSIRDIVLNTDMLPQPVNVKTVTMDFTPKYVELKTLDVLLGESDVHMEGKLQNFIPYVFKDETISGDLLVSSSYLDLNPFLGDEGDEDTGGESAEEPADTSAVPEVSEPLVIPANIDFDMALKLADVRYEDLQVKNIHGGVAVKNGIATLDGLHMELLEGMVDASGDLITGSDLPLADMVLNVKGIDIPGAYSSFNTIEKLAPVAKYCKGTVNGEFSFKAAIDPDYYPVENSIFAKGRLHTRGLQVYNSESFVKVSELLKNEKFREFMPDEVDISFLVKDGKVIVSPFDMKVSASKVTISGEHGLDQSLNYKMDFDIAKSDLGQGAANLMQGLESLAGSAGIKTGSSERLAIKGKVTGTFDKPKFSTDMSSSTEKATEQLVEQAKEVVTEEVKKVESEVRSEASAEAEKILADAQKEADEVILKAQKAGEDLQKKAKEQGDQLIKDAGTNPIKKLAAEKSADELNKQAKKQADNLNKEAREKADAIMQKAKDQAAKINQ